jgi:hypothetical protein
MCKLTNLESVTLILVNGRFKLRKIKKYKIENIKIKEIVILKFINNISKNIEDATIAELNS